MTLNALTSKRIQVWIISRTWPDGNSQVRHIPCNPWYIGRLWRETGFARKARRITRSGKFHLVQSQVRFPGCDVYRAGGGVHAEWLRQRNRISGPLRRLLTRLSPFHASKRRAERSLYADPCLKAVICNSHMVKEEIQSRFGLAEDKIKVIYNAVDVRRFSPDIRHVWRDQTRRELKIEPEETVFLFVGSGFERKGLRQALQGMSTLPPGCRLLVVGQDKQQARYRHAAVRLGVAQRVHFVGLKRDVRPYYAAADAFVLPTLYDAFANTVLEAMACGLPVVTSTKCGAVDIIDNRTNGYVCDALDTQALTRFMGELLCPGTRQRLGRAGRETVKDFSLEQMTSQLVHLYESILDHKGRDA